MLNLNNPAFTKTDKKLLKHSVSNGPMETSEQQVKRTKKMKPKKRKRIIIRNLSFKVEEDDLKELFSNYGKILDVKIPLKDGKKRGFAFIEFEDTKSLIKAMKSLNHKQIFGREVAIDFGLDKTTYQLKMQSLKQEEKNEPKIKKEQETESDTESKSEGDSSTDENENEDESENEDEKRVNAFLKEFDSGADAFTKSRVKDSYDKNAADESSSEESEDSDDEDNDSDQELKIKQEPEEISFQTKQKTKKMDSNDVSEGKTVFLRNVAFITSEESLQEAMEEYGECEYNLLCMDPLTNHPKGTAFVKFKEKSSADKLVQASYVEPGVVVDGRKLLCAYAISREDASHIGKSEKQKSDKRNLYLLRVGCIKPDSEAAKDMSKTDIALRAQIEMNKKQKLKNVNFFISDKRLIIHNLPPTYTDKKLRQLFKKAGGKNAVITEARVMKVLKKTDAQGMPLSKGFGFVNFTKHEDALKALKELNNNPNIFTPQRRPIVEFCVENAVALLTKKRRKEKMLMQNKKRSEKKKEWERNQLSKDDNKAETETLHKGKKRKNKQKPVQDSKKSEQNSNKKSKVLEEVDSPKKNEKKKKEKRNRQRLGKKKAGVKFNQDSISDLKQKYLDKLSNKI